jgi:hypothetical protein
MPTIDLPDDELNASAAKHVLVLCVDLVHSFPPLSRTPKCFPPSTITCP